MRLRNTLAVALGVTAAAASIVALPSRSEAAPSSPPRPVVRVHANVTRQPLEKYVGVAEAIVVARAIAAEPVARTTGAPFTRRWFGVETSLKGPAMTDCEVHVLGVDAPELLAVCDQAPDFTDGEPVLLFLTRLPDADAWGILGLADGTYRIAEGSARRTVRGLHANGEDLGDFEDRIDALLRAQGR